MKMKHQVFLAAIRDHLYRQFANLDNLCAFFERTIEEEQKRRLANGKRQLDGAKDEFDQGWIAESVAEDLFEIERDFPQILRYALFVSMMSITEARIVRLCRAAHSLLNITTPLKEKGPDLIQRAICYLGQEAGLHTSRLKHYITLADELRNIRNAITHSEGDVKGRSDEERIRAFVEQIPTLHIDTRDHLVLDNGFIQNNAHAMKEFTVGLHEFPGKKLNAQP